MRASMRSKYGIAMYRMLGISMVRLRMLCEDVCTYIVYLFVSVDTVYTSCLK